MNDPTSPMVSVVVPVFNEEENMSILQSELRAALKGLDHEIVFVDDGSTDRSAGKIEPASNVRILRFEKNTGQSAALYAGIKAALGQTIVMIDSDLQNDPADITRLLAEMNWLKTSSAAAELSRGGSATFSADMPITF